MLFWLLKDKDKKKLLPQYFDSNKIEIEKEKYGCKIDVYGDFELDEKAYELIEDTALQYIEEKLDEAIYNLESSCEYYYSDEFRDELIGMNDIVFDKFGNIINNDILDG